MAEEPKLVSLIIPVYNESSHLEDFLRQIDRCDLTVPKELVFVDDASRDNSLQIIKDFSFTTPKVVIYAQPHNQGKGAAVRKGIELASGDVIGVQDADFEYSIEEIPSIINPILEGRAEIVFGSRFKKNSPQVHRTFHYLVNRFLTAVSNILSGLYLTDMETCYKFFRGEILKNIHLESNRFGFEPEITAKIAHLKVRVMEIPISYYPRNYMEGKKITWKDGIAAVRHLIVFNLFRDPKSYILKGLPRRYIPSGKQWL